MTSLSCRQPRRTSYPDGSPTARLTPRPKPAPDPAQKHEPTPKHSKPSKSKAPVPDTCGLTLRIRDTDYRVKIIAPDPDAGLIALVRLRKEGGETYHVARHCDGGVSCECGDWVFRKAGTAELCKHIRAAIATGLIPPPVAREDLDAFTRQSLATAVEMGVCDAD